MNEPILFFSRDALRELDRRAVEEFHIPILVLMENAGRAVAEAALRRFGGIRRAMILAGPGNNGGDGLVAARHLHNAGVDVTVLLLGKPDAYTGAAETQVQIIDAMRLKTLRCSTDLREFNLWLANSGPGDLLIDALFGTGLSRAVEGPAADIIHAANASGRTIVSVDIPSGLDCDTGRPVAPKGPAIRATQTVSFCGWKKGFANAREFTGEITIADIGAPIDLLHQLAEPAPPSVK